MLRFKIRVNIPQPIKIKDFLSQSEPLDIRCVVPPKRTLKYPKVSGPIIWWADQGFYEIHKSQIFLCILVNLHFYHNRKKPKENHHIFCDQDQISPNQYNRMLLKDEF